MSVIDTLREACWEATACTCPDCQRIVAALDATAADIAALIAAVRERDAEIARLKAEYSCKRHGLLPVPMCWKCVNEQEAAEEARAEP